MTSYAHGENTLIYLGIISIDFSGLYFILQKSSHLIKGVS